MRGTQGLLYRREHLRGAAARLLDLAFLRVFGAGGEIFYEPLRSV